MNIERLNAWLNLVGNVAILLGLVALAFEINTNTKALRLQILENSAALTQEARLAVAGNPDLQALITKSFLEPAELTPSELWGAISLMERAILDDERQYRFYKSGLLPESVWQSELRSVPYNYGTPFGRLFWSEEKGDFDPDFVAAIENELAKFEGETNDVWLRRFYETVANSDR
jgi:hypothetical protein